MNPQWMNQAPQMLQQARPQMLGGPPGYQGLGQMGVQQNPWGQMSAQHGQRAPSQMGGGMPPWMQQQRPQMGGYQGLGGMTAQNSMYGQPGQGNQNAMMQARQPFAPSGFNSGPQMGGNSMYGAPSPSGQQNQMGMAAQRQSFTPNGFNSGPSSGMQMYGQSQNPGGYSAGPQMAGGNWGGAPSASQQANAEAMRRQR